MSTVRVPIAPVPFSRPVASLTGAQLHELDGGRLALVLVTGKGRRAAAKFYHVEEIPTQIGGRAFRLEPFNTDKLATGESEYVVLLAGPDTSCTCPGHSWTGGCKHATALLAFAFECRLVGRHTE
jgi:hypothetical protein